MMNPSSSDIAQNQPAAGAAPAEREPGRGSLLDDQVGPLSLQYKRSAGDTLRAWGGDIRRASQDPLARRFGAAIAVILAIGLSIWAYLEFWPRAIPDYANADIEDVLDYTLLSDDFNKLPIDQRIKLMKELVERLKSMSAGDSEMMAAFAAGITGRAREQLRENAERLAVDLWDSYAQKYDDIPLDKRSEYLDDAFADFTRLMEDVAGVKSDKTDNERLADARRQARRDAERAREGIGPLQPDRAAPLMRMINQRGDKLAGPQQQARMGRFTRDMVRHLRGQNLDSGADEGQGRQPEQPSGGG